MTDQELIQALGAVVDEKINKAIEPLRQDMQGMKQEITGLKQEQIKTNQRLERLEADTSEIRQDVKQIAFKVDVLYNWVDNVDIRSKNNQEILEHLSKAK